MPLLLENIPVHSHRKPAGLSGHVQLCRNASRTISERSFAGVLQQCIVAAVDRVADVVVWGGHLLKEGGSAPESPVSDCCLRLSAGDILLEP